MLPTTRRLRLRLRLQNGKAHGARSSLSKHLCHPCLLEVLLVVVLLLLRGGVVRDRGQLESSCHPQPPQGMNGRE